MTASDWWLVSLVCVAVGLAGLGLGFFRGMLYGLDLAEDDAAFRPEDPELASLRDETKRLRADLTRQLNNQLDR